MSNTSDTRTIYEIFRACRLCGAGGGYKMPIIQSVIPFECPDIELREKIRECLQIEVKADDKMPPLICELCVDKVNDFYEFLDMCRQTNKRTRLRLGLPPQTLPQGAPDDCILGVTETVFSNNEDRPTPQRSKPCPKSKKNTLIVKKEDAKIETPKGNKMKESHKSMGKRLLKELSDLNIPDVNVKSDTPRTTRSRESTIYIDSRSPSVSGRSSPLSARETRKTAPTNWIDTPRPTRGRIDSLSSNSSIRESRKAAKEDNISLGKIKQQEQKNKHEHQKQTPNKSVLKKRKDDIKTVVQSDSDDEVLSTPIGKRVRDKPGPKSAKEVPEKKIKLTIKLPPAPTMPKLAPNECPICGFVAGSSQGLSNHMRQHKVLYTSPELACDPCGDWFPSPQEAERHHKKHAKYKCRHCKRDYKLLTSYYEHFAKVNCSPFKAAPDVKCASCWQAFPTEPLRAQHRCPGAGGRPGGECKTCHKAYATQKTLKKHEQTCASKTKETKPAARIETKPEPSRRSEVPSESKPAARIETKSKASKRSEVRVDRKIRSRLMKAEIRVAKVDPLLKKRKTKRGRYDVENVPHEYGLDRSRSYPYKYSGARVKPEPLCFDGMVSINKEIQRELYRAEDYVHWDSDLSSDSENEIEEFGEKRRKLPTLTALTLKTIFSNQCLGKVPRKLRKVKQDKLFDSLFNTTADDDLSVNINSIIDDLSKEDNSSVNLLNIMNDDSDSVLDNDKSLLGRGEFDAVTDKKEIDMDININNKNDGESKNHLNDDCDTDASMKDLNDDQNNEVEDAKTTCLNSKTGNAVNNVDNDSNDNDVESDRTDAELSSRDGDSQNNLNPTVHNTEENHYEANEETKENENQEINDDNTESTQNEEANKENGEIKNRDFSNGVSDKSDNFESEIDDNKLMDDLNAQIGESERDIGSACTNFSIDNLIEKPMPQSFGLGSFGDEDFL